MNYVIEFVYNMIETLLLTGFIAMFFDVKPRINKKADIFISFVLIFAFSVSMTFVDLPWMLILFFMTSLFVLILEIFYKGRLTEHIIFSAIASVFLALTDVCVFTLIGKILGVDYTELVTKSSLSRFLAVLTAKTVYLIFISIVISVKKKYSLFLRKVELALISSTLIISGVLISVVRYIIFNTEEYYNQFLIVLLCVLLLNIGQYYTIIYISRKNIKEKNISLMQSQIKMQEDSIRNLELKYDETAKIRHDMKNYISCALKLAEQGDNQALVDYLEELSEDKINTIASYVQTKRKALGAVINSKLGIAESKGFDMQCVILSELDHIKDIDAGIILANLLDNAIEACDKNNGHSQIMLKTWSDAGYYCIEISNTVETDVLANNPNLLTSKKDKSLNGIGLRSVNDIVGKYNGMIDFKQKANVFYVYVSLCQEIN